MGRARTRTRSRRRMTVREGFAPVPKFAEEGGCPRLFGGRKRHRPLPQFSRRLPDDDSMSLGSARVAMTVATTMSMGQPVPVPNTQAPPARQHRLPDHIIARANPHSTACCRRHAGIAQSNRSSPRSRGARRTPTAPHGDRLGNGACNRVPDDSGKDPDPEQTHRRAPSRAQPSRGSAAPCR